MKKLLLVAALAVAHAHAGTVCDRVSDELKVLSNKQITSEVRGYLENSNHIFNTEDGSAASPKFCKLINDTLNYGQKLQGTLSVIAHTASMYKRNCPETIVKTADLSGSFQDIENYYSDMGLLVAANNSGLMTSLSYNKCK